MEDRAMYELRGLEACAEELQEILDFDVHNALESDPVVTTLGENHFTQPGDMVRISGPGIESFWISNREARVLAARLLRTAAQ